MANGVPPTGGMVAKMLSGLLDGWTARHQQGQAQQRQDELYQTQLADKERLAGEAHQRGTERIELQDRLARERAEAKEPSLLDREKAVMDALDLFEKQETIKSNIRINEKQQLAKSGIGVSAAGSLKYLASSGAYVAEVRKTFPAFDSNTQQKIGEIGFTNKVDPLTAAGAYFDARGKGVDLGGIPGVPESDIKREGRKADLVKDLGATGIADTFSKLENDYPAVFAVEDDDSRSLRAPQDQFIYDVSDFMLAQEDAIRRHEISAVEGMASKMQAIHNTVAAGLAGTPGQGYADSPVLNNLSEAARAKVISYGPSKPLPLDPQAINDAASQATGQDILLFGGAESPSFEDIILHMVMQGYDQNDIMDAIKGIFDPQEISDPQTGNIGRGAGAIGESILGILSGGFGITAGQTAKKQPWFSK